MMLCYRAPGSKVRPRTAAAATGPAAAKEGLALHARPEPARKPAQTQASARRDAKYSMQSRRQHCQVLARQRELDELGGGRTRLHAPTVQCVLPRAPAAADHHSAACASNTCGDGSAATGSGAGGDEGGPAALAGQQVEGGRVLLHISSRSHAAGPAVQLPADTLSCGEASLPVSVPHLLLAGFDAALILCGAAAAAASPACASAFAPAARLLRAAAAAAGERGAVAAAEGGGLAAVLELSVSAWSLRGDGTVVDALSPVIPQQLPVERAAGRDTQRSADTPGAAATGQAEPPVRRVARTRWPSSSGSWAPPRARRRRRRRAPSRRRARCLHGWRCALAGLAGDG